MTIGRRAEGYAMPSEQAVTYALEDHELALIGSFRDRSP